MIVRPRPHWIRLLFVRRGSLVVRILQQQLFILLLSCAVVAFHGQLFHWKVTLTSAPFSLLGVALAIFLGFRINVSYERYWEARRLWGAVLVEARNLARQALTLPGTRETARPFIFGLSGFATSMRNQLRGQAHDHALAGLLPDGLIERLRGARFAPALVLLWLGEQVHRWRQAGLIDGMAGQQIEESLNELSGALGGCERIAGTPLPFTYSVILHRSAYLYCMLLPFGLVDTIGMMTPLIVAFISYTFFALEALSDEIEDPFGTMPNDLALDAMVSCIDASLREMLGETPPPAPQPDKNFVLT
ncbi:MAG TPA: bestrophin family ion channel [Aromatoleum sp.]|uniref:bestrophin family protein n=1 Tax=Aromatoleum sp. TaxID=2307007 RepID=UPI002B473E80|nr:bestrophin family ion channel [Aromatoleum sp.]HJV24949.1 bestrophin family ion channel [Aromatoleum sp.]